jgi:hypothetical protein
MWLISRYGFFSIVEKHGDKDKGRLTIRSRAAKDLDNLRNTLLPSLSATQQSDDTDYRYRAHADKTAVAQAFAQAAMEIDYSNFKNTVALEQGYERAHLYGDVWSVLYDLQRSNHP